MRILSVVGTRPEAVKMAPVIAELGRHSQIESRVLATAQHREMLDQVLKVFQVRPDYDLDVMQPGQSPGEAMARVLERSDPVLEEFEPEWVLVQGDTTTVLGVALSAFYRGTRVGHVEAGLRTYDRQNPFPEELNRVLVDQISDLHFAPTATARKALLGEGIPSERIHVTGNTVVDALQAILDRSDGGQGVEIPQGRRLVLVTAHRRENHGEPLEQILDAVQRLAARRDVHVVWPVHRNPNVWEPVHQELRGVESVTLLEPLDYLSFVGLMAQSYLILTDSGGVQEEAPSLGVPVLVMREVTERSEAVEAGVARVVGTDSDLIVAEATCLLDDPADRAAMTSAFNPFGDGRAAERIVGILCDGSARVDVSHAT